MKAFLDYALKLSNKNSESIKIRIDDKREIISIRFLNFLLCYYLIKENRIENFTSELKFKYYGTSLSIFGYSIFKDLKKLRFL